MRSRSGSRHLAAERRICRFEFVDFDDSLVRHTITLTDAEGGTEVVGVHEGLPPGVSVADNEAGWRMALARLAALVEAE